MSKKKRNGPMSSLPPSTPHAEPLESGVADALELSNAGPAAGLVPAADLPSAVDVLAQLFPPDERNEEKLSTATVPGIEAPAESSARKRPHSPGVGSYDPYSFNVSLASKATPAPLTEIATETKDTVSDLQSPAQNGLPSEDAATALSAISASGLSNPSAGALVENTVSSDAHLSPAESADKSDQNALSPDHQAAKESKPRASSSFARIAGGIRSLFSSGDRANTKLDSATNTDNLNSAVAPKTAEVIPSAANVPSADTVSARIQDGSAAAECATATPTMTIKTEIPESPAAPASAGTFAEPAASAEPAVHPAWAAPLSPIDSMPAVSEPAEPFSASAEIPSAQDSLIPDSPAQQGPSVQPESPVQASPEQPSSQELTGFIQEDHHPGDSHTEAAGSDSSPSAEPAAEKATEEAVEENAQEEADPADDDHAIAMAIERYANTAAAAEADLIASLAMSRSVSHLSADSSAADPVDINAVLEIPRDPEPAQPANVPAANFSPDLPFRAILPPSGLGLHAVPYHVLDADDPIASLPPHAAPESSVAPRATSAPYRDWSFEEKLASHHEWIESKGSGGKRADLTGADLEGSDLIGVDLRFVDLHDANLRAADLLMADLRDACLVRANFRDSCLVGANLEAANLEGASLETAMGLVPRQLGGANLHQASLPPGLQFEALSEFKGTARRVHRFFVALMSLSALSALLIWMTKDFQLVTNSAVLFFLHSATAAAALPTVQFYLVGPLALFVLYLVFQFHLQHLWDLALELPAVFPDGRALGENEPRIVVGLLRSHFRWMNADAPSTRFVEKGLSIFLAYWIVPMALTLYWVRFLTLQELRGTVLQELLIVSAAAVALYSTTRVGRLAERWMQPESTPERIMARMQAINPITPALILLGVLTFLAAGTMMGVPHAKDRAPQFMAGSIRRWAPSVLWSFGVDPYADLTEAAISRKPANWTGSDDQVASATGAMLNGANFRYAQAYRAFMVNSHLLHADLQGAFLSQADLRGSDLGQSNLKYAILDQAQMNHVNLDRATLEGANLSRADLRAANLSYAAMANSTLVDARLDGATLYGSRLQTATLIRTNFEKADLREAHLEGANLDNADMQGAYLWSAKLSGARLTNTQLGKAIFVNADLRGADLRWAHLAETVLTGTDLTGANLDGADLRGAVGFGANQVCSAKSRHGALLDDAMQMQVTSQCGAGN